MSGTVLSARDTEIIRIGSLFPSSLESGSGGRDSYINKSLETYSKPSDKHGRVFIGSKIRGP